MKEECGMPESKRDLTERTFAFGVRIVALCRTLDRRGSCVPEPRSARTSKRPRRARVARTSFQSARLPAKKHGKRTTGSGWSRLLESLPARTSKGCSTNATRSLPSSPR